MSIRQTILAAGILVLGGSAAAMAQTVILNPEEEVVVREYIVKQPRTEVVLPEDYDIEVGTALPDTVTVTPLDAPGFEKEYEYVVVEGRTYLVDPETRQVVKVLD